MERTRLKRSAHPKLSTLKFETIALTRRIIAALIINVKSPNVKIFIGRVKTSKTGLTVTLIIPRINATIRAVKKSLT